MVQRPLGHAGLSGHGLQGGLVETVLGEHASGGAQQRGARAHPALAATQRVQATGTCSGTFTARNGQAHHLNDTPVSWQTTEYTPDASCSAETDSGSGQVTFQYGTIRFTISEARVAPVAAFTLK